ncbi:hypothetical protein [Mesorhizobium sp. M0220]|uniref:hypothetical protein n=1 Tax=Mesorhizobium sp. M0220 TaxID=2956920 RepID=UPI00333A96F4
MRKLIVGSFISLDGVIEAPMEWASPFFDEEMKEHSYEKAGEADFSYSAASPMKCFRRAGRRSKAASTWTA